jgi:hypothetical protein
MSNHGQREFLTKGFEMAVTDHITGEGGGYQVGPPAVLSTPCTLQALQNWLLGIQAQGPGLTENVIQITTTNSTITAA